jgi:long-chain acyl-CoA synthetase
VACGGARLEPEVEESFLAAGIHVLQGYGLTETSPVVSLTPYGALKPGTTGKPLDNLEIVFDADGEILVRGPSVFQGYFKDPVFTGEVLRDGWLRTGDLGALDKDGYLVIRGRKKDILVTSSGKNIHPAVIEEKLRSCPLIRAAFVVGDGRKFVGALVIPEFTEIARLAATLQLTHLGQEELLAHPLVRESCQREINRRLEDLSAPEQVRNFAFIDDSPLTDPELITPTQKTSPRHGGEEIRRGDRPPLRGPRGPALTIAP